MDKHVALGQAPEAGVGMVMEHPETVEGRLALLEQKLEAMTKAFLAARRELQKKEESEEQRPLAKAGDYNKDGLPLNMCLIGTSKGLPYIMSIDGEGRYLVGNTVYGSLSAAAEGVSGVRRSGWTFWKLIDGRTIKEVYRK